MNILFPPFLFLMMLAYFSDEAKKSHQHFHNLLPYPIAYALGS